LPFTPLPARVLRLAVLAGLGLALGARPALAEAPAPGTLRGTVTDPSGAAIPGAEIEASGPTRARARTDERGEWRIDGLPAGTYRVRVSRRGFARLERPAVAVSPGAPATIDASLALGRVHERVDVGEGAAPSRGGVLVLEGAMLDALPDDPGEMVAALEALAGAAPGHAPPVLVVGFAGGRVPPKSAIRMVRLNASPYSAEYEYPGVGRIEIFTKPGANGFHGQAQARLGGAALDARDPFADGAKPDYRRLAGTAAVGGPLVPGRASFFLDVERASAGETRLVNATVLGPGLVPIARNETLVAPQNRTTVSPRLDARLGPHTLTVRYAYSSSGDPLSGVGGFALPSRAATSEASQHLLQLGDTFTTGRFGHEVRAQWSRQGAGQDPASTAPALVVQDAFSSGGSSGGRSRRTQDRLELSDVVSWAAGAHALRVGARVRQALQRDESRLGWNGTVTFAGGLGPALDAAGRAVLDDSGQAVLVPLTSLERYRRTLALSRLGLSPAAVRALGGGASLLQAAGGRPFAEADQWDAALFTQDEWRVRPDLVLGLGLRIEAQPGLGGGPDLAPRASFSWTPGRRDSAAPRTVVRGGAGLFYERVSDALFLDARRLDGSSPAAYVIDDPAVLDAIAFDATGAVASLPSFDGLAAGAQLPVVRRIAAGTRAPVTLAASLSLDRTVGAGLTLSAQWTHATTRRALRSRVVSSPAQGGVGYQYESTGRARQAQLMLGATRAGRALSVSARYFLGFAYGDTNGPGSFPASSADPRADWSRASGEARHRLVLTGTVALPGDVRLSTFVVASSGLPYDVTVGRDLDGDTVFAERPAWSSDPSRPGVLATPYGWLDPSPPLGASIVPRNLGRGPGFLSVNLRLSRSFGLFHRVASGRGLTVSLYAQNVLDRANPGVPVGSLASPQFGRSPGPASGVAAGRRSIELQLGTSF
jgi:hypothetical protein